MELLKEKPMIFMINIKATWCKKKERRVCELNADYVGFDIPDKFVVGYGLDVDEKYRNLPYVGYFENV